MDPEENNDAEEQKEPIDALEDAIDSLEPEDKEEVTKEVKNEVNVVKTKTKTFSMADLQRKIRFPQTLPHDNRGLDLLDVTLASLIFPTRGERIPKSIADRFYTMTSGGTGTGAELLAVETLAKLWEDVRLATKVASLFGPIVDMPTKIMKLPLGLGGVIFYKPSGEGVVVTATDLGTNEAGLTAYPLKGQVDVSDELDAGAVVALIPQIRAALIRSAAEALDEAIMNADASTGKENINYYYPTTGADIDTASRFLIGFDGLIHLALNEATGMTVDVAGAPDAADFGSLLSKLGKYAANPDRLAFILDVWTYIQAVQISDFRKVSDLGQRATLLTGQLGEIYGAPVIVCGQILKSCATGQVHQTDANNTKGRMVLVHRDMWKSGSWIPVQVRSERSESKGSTSIVVTMHPALACYGARDAATHTALGFDITV